jgi:phosphoribosylformylglycinamidine synthase subunit PurQ / glutaminase
MPHPERAINESLGNTDGRIVLQSLIMGVNATVTEKAALINF